MDKQELIKEISPGEDSKRQFKVDIKNADSLAAEMVAFSNSEGGTIYPRFRSCSGCGSARS